MSTEQISQSIIDAAAEYVTCGTMRDSAAWCLKDAQAMAEAGKHQAAARRALKSLSYSVGVFDPRYVKASQQFDSMVHA